MTMTTEEPKPKRRWLQFSLRTLMIFVTVFCLWLGITVKRARDRKTAVLAMEQLDGALGYRVNGPAWLRALIGDERCFWDPAGVHFNTSHLITDKDLLLIKEHLESFRRLRDLTLAGSEVTDAGLEHLNGLTNLTMLNISGTQVTDEGVKKLQQALPNCDITH